MPSLCHHYDDVTMDQHPGLVHVTVQRVTQSVYRTVKHCVQSLPVAVKACAIVIRRGALLRYRCVTCHHILFVHTLL